MYPFVLAAGAMAGYFVVAALRRPHAAVILAAFLWLIYAVYEYYVANGTLCDANCNIRVDLVFFFPLLLAATIIALQKEPRTGAVQALGVICLVVAALLSVAFGYNALAVVAGVGALAITAYALKSKFMTNRV
jgi:hypothetical protein